MILYIERAKPLDNFGEPIGEYDVVRVNDYCYDNIPEELKQIAQDVFARSIMPQWFIKDAEKDVCLDCDEQIEGFYKGWNYSGYRGRRGFGGETKSINLRYYAFVVWQDENIVEVCDLLASLYQGEFWEKQGIDRSKIFKEDYLRMVA